MLRLKTIILAAVIIASFGFGTSDAQAGPLLDWLRGIGRRPNNAQQQQYGYYQTNQSAQYTGTAGSNPYNLQPGQCMKTCQQTCSRTVVNYVPATDYRTSWKRVPVTQYRPVTNSDPCTGCTVTCMKPCTTYTYQMQRVPYTTYRPVYRTETYKVPVTTITNDCATGNCSTCPQPMANNGCSTCGPQPGQQMQNFGPAPTPATSGGQYSYPAADVPPTLNSTGINSGSVSQNIQVPSQTLSTAGNYETGRVRAARANVRTASPHSTATRYDNSRQRQNWDRQPVADKLDDQTAQSPITRRWSYSPVRLASFNSAVQAERAIDNVPVRSIRRNVESRTTGRKSLREINSVWSDVK